MNTLEEEIMQYEKDSIAFETGKSKVEPNNAMLISPNELLILLNQKNTEIDQYDAVLTKVRNELTAAGIPELTEDRLTVLPLSNRVYQLCAKLAASIGETVNAVGEITNLRARVSELEVVYQLAVAECVKATNERDLARHSLNECRRERDERSAIIHELMDFDIEDYIQSLPWSDDAKDYEKTLVAGNLRRLFFKLVHQDATLIE